MMECEITRGLDQDRAEDSMSWPTLGTTRGMLLCLCPCVLLGLCAAPVQAQVARMSIPNIGYFGGFGSFNDGNFKSANNSFRGAASAGFNSTEGRWIDSICFHTMIGECYY